MRYFCFFMLLSFPALPASALNQMQPIDLKEWSAIGDANWEFTNGVVQANSGTGFLVSNSPYSDFRLTIDFYPGKNTNSGVFLRCADSSAISDSSCYEANIFDHRPDPAGRTGSIVNVEPPLVHLDTEGRWNTYEIIAHGSRLVVKLNGVTTVDTIDNKHSVGLIALQFASGGIKFRNVNIESLETFEKDIIGVWQLSEFELIDAEGKSQPWCKGSFGSIMYFKNYMSVAINCASNAEKTVFYSGPYRFDAGDVIHEVKNYGIPDLNQVLRRKVEMSNSNSLKLIGAFGVDGRAVISWKKLGG